jgi:hypothetical protein
MLELKQITNGNNIYLDIDGDIEEEELFSLEAIRQSFFVDMQNGYITVTGRNRQFDISYHWTCSIFYDNR